MITWQKTGKVAKIDETFVWIWEDDVEMDDPDARPYPVHAGDATRYRVGDRVLMRESVEKLG